jgi:hypothetical protein
MGGSGGRSDAGMPFCGAVGIGVEADKKLKCPPEKVQNMTFMDLFSMNACRIFVATELSIH